MSINPPSEIAGFFSFVTGMEWPQADEDLMRQVADAYRGAADDLELLEGLIGRLVPVVLENFEGISADAFAGSMGELIGRVNGGNVMAGSAELSRKLGDVARQVANQVEYTKLMAILQLVQLLAQVLAAQFFAPFTFGGSYFNATLAFALTREALRNLFWFLVRAIASNTFAGVMGSLFSDAVIQAYQLGSGHTDKWQADLTLDSFKSGLLEGVFAGPAELLGQVVGKFLGRLIGKGPSSLLTKNIDEALSSVPVNSKVVGGPGSKVG
ncbi:hypothetical protein, partial [Streptomyces sp. NPDC059185]|uniref:WXG100-like domain-containing protein n=1 Tax=Streptomyces sp. NPDC059185 TaxID=3346762 RepID=UPI0036BBE7A2